MADNGPDLRIRKTPEEAAGLCAAYILESLNDTLAEQRPAAIAISGGKTPQLLFTRMAKSEFDWSKVHFFWVDERCVPPTSDQSNYKLAFEALLHPAGIPKENIHRIQGEMPPEQSTAQYVEEVKQFFSISAGELPVFDILHRGIGPDAHTASLFPGEPLIKNRTDIAAHVWVEKLRSHRVTLLPGVLIAAKRTVLQVSGEEKKEAVRNVLTGAEDPMTYPCQIASRDSKAIWFLDETAASRL